MPSKCGADQKGSGRNAQVSKHIRANYLVAAPNQQPWERLPVETDAHRDTPRTPYASREFWSAEAFVHGCRICPEEFVSYKASGDRYLSSRELITKSHKLITASKQRVRRVNADMALRRRPGESIN